MQSQEILATTRVTADAWTGAVRHVQGLHRTVARRAFGYGGLRPSRSPVARAHDLVADAVYGAVATAGRLALRGAGELAAAGRRPDAPRLAELPAGDLALGALNGAFGRRFAATGSPLELPMTLRHRGRDLDLSPAALRRDFPLTDGRVVVLVHGLCLTDASWRAPRRSPAQDDVDAGGGHDMALQGSGADAADLRHAAREAADARSFTTLLHRELGFDVLTLRYNTGRRIPANGADLARLLERLHQAWPGGLRDVALVGHSMGGLVVRSAGAAATAAGHGWPSRVRDVVLLGSPQLGANLERLAATGAWAAGLVPETRGIADLLALRSDGVLDLRDGLLLDEDAPAAIDRWPWGERGTPVPLLPGARHHAVAVTLHRDPERWLARSVLGDLLVTPASALARARGARRLTFAADDVVLMGGLSHFDLLHHPRVWAHLRRWLAPTPALPAATAA